jgi:hypothetical protein
MTVRLFLFLFAIDDARWGLDDCRWLTMISKIILIQSDECTMALRLSSALRHHCLKKWRWGWAPRPASDAYGKLSLRLDLPSSGGQPKRPSI